MTRFYLTLLTGIVGAIALISPAQAQDSTIPGQVMDPPASLFAKLPKATNLDAQSGKQDVTLINNTNSATLAGTVGSTAISDSMVNTGSNLIGSGAFNGMAGIGTVIQNTGNNVLIQDSTIMNVTMH